MQVLKHQLRELKYMDKCTFCVNGLETLKVCTEIIEVCLHEVKKKTHYEELVIRPISLLLLDF